MKKVKTRVAAATTVVALGGLTGFALNAGGTRSASVEPKPLVRTKVIRRTIHVTRHRDSNQPVGAGGGGGGVVAPGSTPSAEAGAQAAPAQTAAVVTHTSGTGAEPASGGGTVPVVTQTSGAGGEGASYGDGNEAEHEHEGGEDD